MKALMIAALMAVGLQASAQTARTTTTDTPGHLQSHRVYRPHIAPEQRTAPEKRMAPEQRAEKQSKRMAKHLNLDDRQQRAVYAANLEAARKMGPVHDRMRDAKMDARRIRRDRDESLRSTLTGEQYQKMMEFRSRRHTARLERCKGRGRMNGRRDHQRREGTDDRRS